jgi:hypothetical protein
VEFHPIAAENMAFHLEWDMLSFPNSRNKRILQTEGSVEFQQQYHSNTNCEVSPKVETGVSPVVVIYCGVACHF